MKRLLFAIFAILGVLSFTVAGRAADKATAGHAVVAGVIHDALGRPIPYAAVTLEAQTRKIVGQARTDQAGHFEFKNVEPGTYLVSAQKKGFHNSSALTAVTSAGVPDLDIALGAESALSLNVVTSVINRQPNALSKTGNSEYTLTHQDIVNLPQGENTPINQVLLQMPGVVQDDEAQIHVEGEHLDLQWRVNGIMMPFDSFSGFGQVFNSFFVQRVSLLDGVLPVTYGFRDAGVLDLVTKDGCSSPGGDVGFYGGQRETYQPSFEYGGCEGPFSYYVTGTYLHNNLAFSSATPGPTPYHDIDNQGEGFGYFTYQINPVTKLSFTTGISVNNGQWPSEPGLTPAYQLYNINPANYPSQKIAENLDQDYYFGILALSGLFGPEIAYQVAYTSAYSTIQFNPDPIGDLIYQGGASTAFHSGFDNTLQTDLSRTFETSKFGTHNIGGGFYVGEYGVELDDTTSVFPANSAGVQTGNVPFTVVENTNKINFLWSVYLQDIWHVNEALTVTAGLREDGASGMVTGNQLSPRVNVLYQLNKNTALHAGYARYFQTPDFQTISPRSFTLFQNSTAAVGQGATTLLPERDNYWNVGLLHHFGPHLTFEENAYFRLSHNLIDLGQFGFVPIFAPFNYSNGRIYGTESTLSYNWKHLQVRGNFTFSVAQGNQVETGQFNFEPDEVTYIANHYIYLDHTQFYTASGGIAYNWAGYLFSLTGTYGSGLRAGFANTSILPANYDIDLAVEKGWRLPTIGEVKTRAVVVNVTDNINELRNGTGIGIFEPGYGQRRTFYGGITVPLPAIGSSGKTP